MKLAEMSKFLLMSAQKCHKVQNRQQKAAKTTTKENGRNFDDS